MQHEETFCRTRQGPHPPDPDTPKQPALGRRSARAPPERYTRAGRGEGRPSDHPSGAKGSGARLPRRLRFAGTHARTDLLDTLDVVAPASRQLDGRLAALHARVLPAIAQRAGRQTPPLIPDDTDVPSSPAPVDLRRHRSSRRHPSELYETDAAERIRPDPGSARGTAAGARGGANAPSGAPCRSRGNW